MPSVRGPAYILRVWDMGESDLLVSFLEEHRGKRRGVARGARKSRKRFGGLLVPLGLVQLEYTERPGRSLVRLDGCSLIHYHAAVSEHLGKLLAACCMREALERVLPEEQGGDDFFPLLHRMLGCLDRDRSAGFHLWVFLLHALALLGLKPQLDRCIHCRRPLTPAGLFGFSVPLGGPVCGACIGRGTSTHRAHADSLRLMRQWLEGPCTDPVLWAGTGRAFREACDLIETFYRHHVVREFRSLGVLRDLGKHLVKNRKEDARDRAGSH